MTRLLTAFDNKPLFPRTREVAKSAAMLDLLSSFSFLLLRLLLLIHNSLLLRLLRTATVYTLTGILVPPGGLVG